MGFLVLRSYHFFDVRLHIAGTDGRMTFLSFGLFCEANSYFGELPIGIFQGWE